MSYPYGYPPPYGYPIQGPMPAGSPTLEQVESALSALKRIKKDIQDEEKEKKDKEPKKKTLFPEVKFNFLETTAILLLFGFPVALTYTAGMEILKQALRTSLQ